MKNLHSTEENTVQQGNLSESDKKRDVNLKSNSSLYFQIGLILCLLATYGLFEMNFKMHLPSITIDQPFEDDPFYINEIIIEPDAPKPRPVVNKLVMLTDKPPIIKPNDFVIPDPVEIVTPDIIVPVDNPVVKNNKPTEPVAPPIPTIFNMNDVEKVPIFPGCESAKNNEERMACMSDKLTKLIQKKFNTDLAYDLGLSGIQRIQVQFKIDDRGQVTDIKTRSPYSQLEVEAQRVVSKIPVMKPGMQRNTPVSVVYNLPIAFQVH